MPAAHWSGAPGAQLIVEGGNGRRFMMRLSGMPTDGGGGLGAEVADFGVKIERADAVFTVRAGEPYAALEALDTVRFHSCIVTLRELDWALDGVAAKVTWQRTRKRGSGRGVVVPPRVSCKWTGEDAVAPSLSRARMPAPHVHYFVRRLYFFSTSRSLSWGSAITVWLLMPVIVSAAIMALTMASSVACTVARKIGSS
jgi:hypothetical protein